MDLRTYLTQSGMGPSAFARHVGLSRNGLYKLLNGAIPRDGTAEKIESATGGEVTLDDFWQVRRARYSSQSERAA